MMWKRTLASVCRVCPLCVAARRWPGSWIAPLVRWYSPICPFCRAYRRQLAERRITLPPPPR